MQGYDILMLVILAGTTIWGAFKGMAWQLAALASLGASYFVSYYLSDPLVNTGWFGQSAPVNRFAAMLALYVLSGAVIWMGFRVISDTIEKIKLRDFDRQLGGLFGFCKGVLFCMLITFFVVTLLPAYRDQVINTHSGRVIARLLNKADAIMPAELHTLLDPYLQKFEANMQPGSYAAPVYGPTQDGRNATTERPWSLPINLPAGLFGQPSNEPGRGPASEAPYQPPVYQQPAYQPPSYQPPVYQQPQPQPWSPPPVERSWPQPGAPQYQPPAQTYPSYPSYPQSYGPAPGPWNGMPNYGPQQPSQNSLQRWANDGTGNYSSR